MFSSEGVGCNRESLDVGNEGGTMIHGTTLDLRSIASRGLTLNLQMILHTEYVGNAFGS